MTSSSVPILSNVERDFIMAALAQPHPERIDGRRPLDHRSVSISFPGRAGTSMVQLGRTRVLSRIQADLVTPPPERPTEGVIRFFVDVPGDKTSSSIISSTLEKCIRDSGAIDVETLCVLSGIKVWSLRVTLAVIDQRGNAMDCICLAALASLRHFRRRAVTVVGTSMTVHSLAERAPVALHLHHMPICTTFVLCGGVIVADPSEKEAVVAGAHLTIACNIRKHVCLVVKSGGTPMELDQFQTCLQVACDRAETLNSVLEHAVAEDHARRQERLDKGGHVLESGLATASATPPPRIQQENLQVAE